MDDTNIDWRTKLSPQAYDVCCLKGTERPFSGEFWNHSAKGVYHCVCCNTPLFVSDTKFDAGCGWPSFFEPIRPSVLREETDTTHGMIRTEVMCDQCGAHLGHVFPDGPKPTGLRFCINSVSLTFEANGAEEGGNES